MWKNFVSNPELLSSFYNELPSLECIQIDFISIDYGVPSLTLTIGIPKFPDKPSPKWHASAKYFYIDVCFNFNEIILKKFGTQNFVSISSEPSDQENLFRISFKGDELDLELFTLLGYIQHYFVY